MGTRITTIYPLAARTATVTGTAIGTVNTESITVLINVDAVSGTSPSLLAIIEGWDQAANEWYTILSGSSIVTAGREALTIGPAVPTSSTSATQVIPTQLRVNLIIGGTSPSFTCSVAGLMNT